MECSDPRSATQPASGPLGSPTGVRHGIRPKSAANERDRELGDGIGRFQREEVARPANDLEANRLTPSGLHVEVPVPYIVIAVRSREIVSRSSPSHWWAMAFAAKNAIADDETMAAFVRAVREGNASEI